MNEKQLKQMEHNSVQCEKNRSGLVTLNTSVIIAIIVIGTPIYAAISFLSGIKFQLEYGVKAIAELKALIVDSNKHQSDDHTSIVRLQDAQNGILKILELSHADRWAAKGPTDK